MRSLESSSGQCQANEFQNVIAADVLIYTNLKGVSAEGTERLCPDNI